MQAALAALSQVLCNRKKRTHARQHQPCLRVPREKVPSLVVAFAKLKAATPRKQNTTTITMKSSGLQRTSSMTAMIDRKKRPIEPASQQARARMREARVARDTFREKLRRGVRRLADALIAPLPKTRSIEDEAKIELVRGGVLRALFIGGTALASAWSLTLFGAKWQAPQWQAPRVKQPVLVAPKPKTPVFVKPQWRLKNDS